jgi:hypothetical protein
MHFLRVMGLSALLAFGASVPAGAQEFLTGKQLETELGGKTIKGYYLDDKVNFVEIYLPDGRITYKDDQKADGGQWFVRGRAFCTYYDRINGACWYVVKISGNCFEFHVAPPDGREIDQRELAAREPRARAARDSDKVTCDAWLGS